MDKPLRILSLADMPPDVNSGAAGSEVRTFELLRELGHEVDAIWRDDLPHRIQHPNLHILFELPKALERATAKALSRAQYDVVHMNQPHGHRAAAVVRRMAPGTLFVHRSHGFELHSDQVLAHWRKRYAMDDRSLARRMATAVLEPMLQRHSRLTAKVADAHNVLCELDKDYLHNVFGIDRDRIVVVPVAAPDSFRATPAPSITPERLKCVLHVAQFAFFKAPMITADAMNRLAAWRSDLEFVWVCDQAHHGSVRALLSPEVNERLELFHWRKQEELMEIYDRCGIFLFPSFFEGFGKVILEAMCRGMCVVGSDVGGLHDAIRQGQDGLLVPTGDAGALFEAARSLIDDLPRSVRMGERAAERAREYSWEKAAKLTAEFYRRRVDIHRRELH
jgi:glycosyltransferase involved in cell wall biosynthesis